MPVTPNVLREGLSALSKLLPSGYSLGKSALRPSAARSEAWIVISDQRGRKSTCLVLSKRRIEARDVAVIADRASTAQKPTLVVAPRLSQAITQRLQGLDIGCWDLQGNARITLATIDLRVHAQAASPAGTERKVRSLGGELAGRLARALIDCCPPHAIGALAQRAQVDPGYASRAVAFLVECGLLQRKERGEVVAADWEGILRRWWRDSPMTSRGQAQGFVFLHGAAALLSRLRTSGLLHAITGTVALERLVGQPVDGPLTLYVDDVLGAANQLGLHPSTDEPQVVLIKPSDRSVFRHVKEFGGLHYVAPSTMAADLSNEAELTRALAWMERNQPQWRSPSVAAQTGQPRRGTRSRR
jgi:hypothetical protein